MRAAAAAVLDAGGGPEVIVFSTFDAASKWGEYAENSGSATIFGIHPVITQREFRHGQELQEEA